MYVIHVRKPTYPVYGILYATKNYLRFESLLEDVESPDFVFILFIPNLQRDY